MDQKKNNCVTRRLDKLRVNGNTKNDLRLHGRLKTRWNDSTHIDWDVTGFEDETSCKEGRFVTAENLATQ